MTDNFSITLPLSENVATVQHQKDGTFKILVSGDNFTHGGYYYYSPTPTFEDAVRIIMGALWDDYLHNAFAGKSKEEIRVNLEKANAKIFRNANIGSFGKSLSSEAIEQVKIQNSPYSEKPVNELERADILRQIQIQMERLDISPSETATILGIGKEAFLEALRRLRLESESLDRLRGFVGKLREI